MRTWVSAPIASTIFKEIISLYDLEEDTEGIPKAYRWDDVKYVTIPEILGKTKKEATKILKSLYFNIEYSGTGDKVIDSSPQEGDRVKEKSTIKLLLN